MGKYTINLNAQFTELDGTEIAGASMGKILANVIVQQSKGDAVKLYGWALDLSKGNHVSIDKSDYDTLKTFVKESEALPILSKAQILNIINEAKEE